MIKRVIPALFLLTALLTGMVYNTADGVEICIDGLLLSQSGGMGFIGEGENINDPAWECKLRGKPADCYKKLVVSQGQPSSSWGSDWRSRLGLQQPLTQEQKCRQGDVDACYQMRSGTQTAPPPATTQYPTYPGSQRPTSLQQKCAFGDMQACYHLNAGGHNSTPPATSQYPTYPGSQRPTSLQMKCALGDMQACYQLNEAARTGTTPPATPQYQQDNSSRSIRCRQGDIDACY